MLRTTQLALALIESLWAGVDSRKNRTVDLSYPNEAFADSTTSRGVNDPERVLLIRRYFCRCCYSTRSRGAKMCEFDQLPGGYRPQFRQIAGGFDERFDHLAGGTRYSTIAWGVLSDSTVLRGVGELNFQAKTRYLQRCNQCPGG